MSVGGKVVETIVLPDKVWINARDKYEGDCAIYVENDARARCVSEGDALWWQGSNAYWTPKAHLVSYEEARRLGYKQGQHYEIPLTRRGFSGVKRPETTPSVLISSN